jgi:serine/threonine-protein kinase
MYEMLNGKPPFDGRIPTEVVMMHLRDKPAPLPSDIPPALAQAVMKALDKDPARRQQTAEELDQECQQLMMELNPRQTPMGGVPMMGAPSRPMGPPPGGNEQQRTMIAEAPVINRAPPMASSGPPPAAAPAGSELRTMMAQAPMLPTSSAPPSSAPLVPPAGGNSDMRTMMAQPAPVLPSNTGNEAKTMMAQAPMLPSSAPPPGGRPQASPNSDMRTMMAQPAPVIPQQQPQQPQPQQPAPQAQGTMMLPDSQGVVSYNQNAARQARAEMSQPSSGGGILFWAAWIVLGIGAGLGVHYYLIQRAAQ